MTTGTYFINGHDASYYGITFDDSAVSALLTPAPAKERIKNKIRTQHGTKVTKGENTEKVDERSLNLNFNIHALNKADFFDKYGKFCSEVLETGHVNISTTFIPNMEFKCLYESCPQMQEFRFQLGKYQLRLNEPNPKDRTLEMNASLM